MHEEGENDIQEPVKKFFRTSEKLLAKLSKYFDDLDSDSEEGHELQKEYEIAAETILAIHCEQIVTDASQVLIRLLEDYINKINTHLLSSSFFDLPGRKTDLILAKHCLKLLNPELASDRTGDTAIYYLLKYLNLHPEKLDIKQGATQILCAFFSLYRHYTDGLSEELAKQLQVHNLWDVITYGDWVAPLLVEMSYSTGDARKRSFEKLSAVQSWMPENTSSFQQLFTLNALAGLKRKWMNSEDRRSLISGLEQLTAWISPASKEEIVENLAFLLAHDNYELAYPISQTINKLMEGRIFYKPIDFCISALLNHRDFLQKLGSRTGTFNMLNDINKYSELASPDCQSMLMASLSQEFLQVSDVALSGLLCKSFNQLHVPLPPDIQDDVLAKIVRLLRYNKDSSPPRSHFNDFCDTFIKFGDNMTRTSRENLCYDLFKSFIRYHGWETISKPINEHFSKLIEMMSPEKQKQLIEHARSQMIMEFMPELFDTRKTFLQWKSQAIINSITIIAALMGTVTEKMEMQTRFFDDLMVLVMDKEQYYETISTATKTLNHLHWHLSDEYKIKAIQDLFDLINQKAKYYHRSKKPFALKLIAHLSAGLDEATCEAVNDGLLALIHKKGAPGLKCDAIAALIKLQAMLNPQKRTAVAESLITYLKNPQKKKIVKVSIINFIKEEQKRNPLPVYETVVPILIDVIKLKTKHRNFQIAACGALCQFSTTQKSELKRSISSALIDTIKNTTDTDLWQALYQSIAALQHWLTPEQKTKFMLDLIGTIPNTKKNEQAQRLKALFTLRDWLSAEQHFPALEETLNNLLIHLDCVKNYRLLEELMPILNESERINVIHHLIAHLDHDSPYMARYLIMKYAANINDNDKISLLARLRKLGLQGENWETNRAKSLFVMIYNIYHQSIKEKLLENVAQQHNLPVEITQHILGYARA
ncbi:hypothetical protein [Fluoribacter gormanii]|uniref:Uncharacterized protein n=1 Tax=Fluoribacter gormanii TaxID=464 RepID=A0A377GNK8_9GAMM|nr:hypothetical protein [Fluoribacter gormanii]KTD00536.1 hypothetical protein Lgor_3012 [Fluoribacter gormanii]SIR07122.1 hypothetical protein SAMN05421777_10645 [Fluoribacter gormanii]STO26386.1 Uncharacterised protein [Fluoribacter gormanii]